MCPAGGSKKTNPIKPNFKTLPVPKIDRIKLIFSFDFQVWIVKLNAKVGGFVRLSKSITCACVTPVLSCESKNGGAGKNLIL
jgi:hypothetical protein